VFAISIGIILVLGAAAAAAYFFVLPLFSPDAPRVTIDETPRIEENVPQPLVETPFVHEGFFTVSADVTTEADLVVGSPAEINAAMTESEAPGGTLEEFEFNLNGTPAMAQDVMAALLPGLDGAMFDEDFTAFLYHGEDGEWPGYIFMLDENANANSAALAVRGELEGDANLGAFYLEEPGEADEGSFQSGLAAGVPTRYLLLGIPGASFNYGWSGDFLILSTSFEGFQEAVGLLGG